MCVPTILSFVYPHTCSCLCSCTHLCSFVCVIVSLLVPATWSFSFCLCSCSFPLPLIHAHSVVLSELVPATWLCLFDLHLYLFGLILALFILVLAHSFMPTRLCSFELILGTWSCSFGLCPCLSVLIWARLGFDGSLLGLPSLLYVYVSNI